jgi:HKD family nuclease
MKLEILGPGPKSLGLKPLLWYIEECLNEIKKDGEFLIVSALTDTEGLNLLSDTLDRAISLGCTVKAVIGMDLGISRGALRKLDETFGNQNVFIYCNPADSTFHPKMYLIRADDSTGTVIIGSSNLTSAGFLRNFEVNIALKLDLHNKDEKAIFQGFVKTFNDLLKERSTRPLTMKLQSELEKKIERITKTVAETKPGLKLSEVFEGEDHGWEIPAFQGKNAFLMTLSYNDVSGVRGDLYIRIPVIAVISNPKFWGWPKLFSPSAKGYPERLVHISYEGKSYRYRFYFAETPDEFRLVMPQIYTLGATYEGSILKISKKPNMYSLELVLKADKKFGRHLKHCTEECPRGRARVPKMWGYI